MKRELRKTGNIEQMAYIRKAEYQEGAAGQLTVYQVKNGLLQFSAAIDKCLDITELSYKGINLSFLSKNGLSSGVYSRSYPYSDRSVMGGMLFTCGPDNVGPGELKRQLPVHGSFRFTPSYHPSSECFFDSNGMYHMVVKGVIEPAGLFEGHIRMERKIETIYGENRIQIRDRFRNMGYEKEALMLLYHCNFSYPFLDSGCQVRFPSSSVVLREEMDRQTDLPYSKMDEPMDGGKEEVFFHEAVSGEDGKVTVSVYNPKLDLEAKIIYEKKELPKLIQWKSMISGDYALGIEPANCLVFGREYEERHGTLPYLDPGEEKVVHITLEVAQKEHGK